MRCRSNPRRGKGCAPRRGQISRFGRGHDAEPEWFDATENLPSFVARMRSEQPARGRQWMVSEMRRYEQLAGEIWERLRTYTDVDAKTALVWNAIMGACDRSALKLRLALEEGGRA